MLIEGSLLPKSIIGQKWQDRLAEAVFNESGDKKFKTLTGWNDGLVNKLVKLQSDTLLPGADRLIYMEANSGASEAGVRAFVRLYPQYKGEDEPAAFNPVAAVGNLMNVVPTMLKSVPTILLIVAVGVGGYLLLAGSKGVDFGKYLPVKRKD